MSDEVVQIIVVAAVVGFTGGLALVGGSVVFTAFATTAALTAAAVMAVSIAFMPKPPSLDLGSFATTLKDRQQTFKQPITSRKIVYGNIKVGGPLIYVTSTDKSGVANSYLHMIVLHASHEIQSFGSWFIDGNEITLDQIANGANGGNVNAGDYKDLVRINPKLGSATQSADSDLISEAPDGEWDTAHTLSGIAYTYVRFEYNADAFQSIPSLSTAIFGKKIYDPRNTNTVYSANSALVLRDYLTSDLGMGISANFIDDASVITASNVCDEDVSLAEGGTEKRYETHGMIDTDIMPSKNISDILSSMHGNLVYSNGKFKMTAGTTKTAVLSIDENDFVGSVSINPRMSRRDNFNAVKGQFISVDNNYQPTDYPFVTSTVFQNEDNGEQIFRELNLPMTKSTSMAQRLAKIGLYRQRQPLQFSSTHNLSVLGLDVGDIASITFAKYGWSGKQFEVISWSFGLGEQLAINIAWKEYADSVYSWTTTEQQVIADAPNTNLPNAFNILPPSNLVAVETLTTTRDGRGVQSLVTVTFNIALDAFATYYEVQYKDSTSDVYISLGQNSATKVEILDLAPATYNIRVRSISTIGSKSVFVSLNKEVLGLADAPTAMTNLNIEGNGGFAFLQWDRSTDLDVRVGGKVEIRHQNVTNGATWITSTLVDDSKTGMDTSAMVPLRAGTYLLKFVDSSGSKQVNATSVVTEGLTILNFSTSGTVTENPNFTGTKANLYKDDSNRLGLTATGQLDSQSNFDAIPIFDLIGSLNTSGTYTFANTLDLSSSKRCRLQASTTMDIFLAQDLVDLRTANINTWEDFDGTSGGAVGNIELYYRSSSDNSSYSAYKKFTSVEEQNRYFQFKAIFSTQDPAYSVRASTMVVTASII